MISYEEFSFWILWMKAVIMRGLMAVGMRLHHAASPRPPSPAFTIKIPSRLSAKHGTFKLVFYVPEDYQRQPDRRFPVVVNFHGGGFTLGTGTDDARWARYVIDRTDSVFISVEYRLAPEHPFSIGIEDGTDALMYIAAHAEELRLDAHKIALSGFSAGGNFTFTVPLMLHDLKNDAGKRTIAGDVSKIRPTISTMSSSSTLNVCLDPNPNDPNASHIHLKSLEPTELEIHQKVPDLTIRAIVSFYPPTDFRIPRCDKRETNPMPAKNLPAALTDLFDTSYLPAKDGIDPSDPYLSPMAASDALLAAALPQNIILYTCEYDMLNAEGVAFGERLKNPPISKIVTGGLINAVPHAFDRKPNPLKFSKAAEKAYGEACAQLASVFGIRNSFEERRQLDEVKSVDRFEEGRVTSTLNPEDIKVANQSLAGGGGEGSGSSSSK